MSAFIGVGGSCALRRGWKSRMKWRRTRSFSLNFLEAHKVAHTFVCMNYFHVWTHAHTHRYTTHIHTQPPYVCVSLQAACPPSQVLMSLAWVPEKKRFTNQRTASQLPWLRANHTHHMYPVDHGIPLDWNFPLMLQWNKTAERCTSGLICQGCTVPLSLTEAP